MGLLAAGKIAGDFTGFLALGGGLASFALGGNFLYGASQISDLSQKDVHTVEGKNEEISCVRIKVILP